MSKDFERRCIACDVAFFTGELPVIGECRRNPPRGFQDKKSGENSRFFPMVRFNDWCGQFKKSKADDVIAENEKKLLPVSSVGKRLEVGLTTIKQHNFKDGLSLLEPIFDELDYDEKSKVALVIGRAYNTMANDDEIYWSDCINWYQTACELKNSEAFFTLGMCYLKGYGVEGDKNKAMEYLTFAKDHGLSKAEKKLAEINQD